MTFLKIYYITMWNLWYDWMITSCGLISLAYFCFIIFYSYTLIYSIMHKICTNEVSIPVDMGAWAPTDIDQSGSVVSMFILKAVNVSLG